MPTVVGGGRYTRIDDNTQRKNMFFIDLCQKKSLVTPGSINDVIIDVRVLPLRAIIVAYVKCTCLMRVIVCSKPGDGPELA